MNDNQTPPADPATESLGFQDDQIVSSSYPVLGIPVFFKTNRREIAREIDRHFSYWNRLPGELRSSGNNHRVSIIIHPEDRHDNLDQAFTYRLHDGLLLGSGPGVLMSADRNNRCSTGFVSPKYAASQIHFKKNVLECLTLFIITGENRIPIHASGVFHQGKVILFAGRSGSGKTSLAYGFYRKGAVLLSDESVYGTVSGPEQIWSMPTGFNLCPDASQLFPELQILKPERQANGKMKIRVELGSDEQKNRTRCVHSGEIILLMISRSDGPQSSIQPLEVDQAKVELAADPETGYDLSPKYLEAIEKLRIQSAFSIQNNGKLDESLEIIQNAIISKRTV